MAQPSVALHSTLHRPTADCLVEQNVPLVGHFVREVLAKVPAHVNRDDLMSAGMMGLVLSARAYDPERGVPFSRFAALRIRGALIDELRGMDWAARAVRSKARETERVRDRLTAALGRPPRLDELAAALGVDIPALIALQSDVARAGVLSLNGLAPGCGADLIAETAAGPEKLILLRERLGYLHDAIAELPDRLRFVVTAYFFDQRLMTDIAAQLGVTESRVSQLRAEALRFVRDAMDSLLEPPVVEHRRAGRQATTRQNYIAAVAARSTLAGRLGMSTPRGEVRAGVVRPAHLG